MPTINIKILRAWRHANETGRIHYAIQVVSDSADYDVRHLYADDGDALYEVLEKHLVMHGYTGPKSAVTR